MDLKSFVKRSLADIVGAVQEADYELKREILFPTRQGENIHFDIAVTIEDSKTTEGGIQILKVVSGALGNEIKNTTTSRLSFSLYIAPSDREKQLEERKRLRSNEPMSS